MMKSPHKRKAISKGLRFSIFSRDGFTCRYCGNQSDTVTLHIDHIIPVCQGGTNDEANLVTSCIDCNLGKAGRTIEQSAPTESDRLRMAQEMREQREAAEFAREIRSIKKERFQDLVNYWTDITGRESVHRTTISVIFHYVLELGEDVVYDWIERAAERCNDDKNMGKYVSGIRRSVREEEGTA